jgi:hypothetical protein
MADQLPQEIGQNAAAPVVAVVPVAAPLLQVPEPTPAIGGRQALRDLRRQLRDEDLTNPGVVKLILDNLAQADGECDRLRAFEGQFHFADKRVGILEEKLRTNTAIEVAFGVGLGLGCAILGLAPTFYGLPSQYQFVGTIAVVVGLLLVVGAVAVRVTKK